MGSSGLAPIVGPFAALETTEGASGKSPLEPRTGDLLAAAVPVLQISQFALLRSRRERRLFGLTLIDPEMSWVLTEG